LSTNYEHQKSILLLEDNKIFAGPVMRWLKKADFAVFLATTLDEALQRLEEQNYHMAIVDLRLDDNDESNKGGMDFLRIKDEYGLREVMPVIVLTGNATTDNVLEAFTKFGVFSYIKKEPGYREKLLSEVERAFQEKIQINFDLNYDESSDEVLDDVVRDIYWADRFVANSELLVAETRDLFGKLFRNAESVYLTKLKPGLSGAGLVQADPCWLESGLGPPRVVKVDRVDKSLMEKHNYETYVKNPLPLATTQVSYERSRHLGGALYSFAEEGSIAFMEFDDFYRRSSLKAIEMSLQGLIFKTCRYWYDHMRRKRANLQTLYFQAFNLEKNRLILRLQEILPDYDPAVPNLIIPGDDRPLINPLHWLAAHQKQSVLAVKMCITHGDMTGRNIMVDGNGKCWMIDFLRTYESHSLRDFVILETDLKYRQAPQMRDQDFLEFEKNLIYQGIHHTDARPPVRWAKDTKKLFSAIMMVRNFAHQVAFGVANSSQMDFEFSLSLLMATLNVIRFRHIPPARKMQALRAASMICKTLGE
jgi:ActR/RegA family two-component response regulator